MNINASGVAKQFPELDELLGGHFHQDWATVFDWQGQTPNRDDVVCSFVETYPPEYVSKTKEQLNKLLSLPLSEDSLKKILLEDFAVAYNPKHDKMTVREWLERVLQILQEPPNPKNQLKRKRRISPKEAGLDLDALGFPRINKK